MSELGKYEYDFDPAEPNNTAAAVYRMASAGGERILDLGSGPGIVAGHLARHDGKRVTCVDSSIEALAAARQRGIERTIHADLATDRWLGELGGETFDVIILADVLEHLVDPPGLLETIAQEGLLSDGGQLVVSIPNAGHEAVLAELVSGRFTYQDMGLLDSTHLRFFTLASLRELLERSGFFITAVERTRRTAEQTSLAVHDLALPQELRDRVLQASPEARTYQFIVTARRASAARDLAEVREQLEVARAQLSERARSADRRESRELSAQRAAEAERAVRLQSDLDAAQRERARLEQRVAELERANARARQLTATERKRYEKAIEQAEQAAASSASAVAEREIARLKKELADIYRSRTWKVGKAAWTAFHAPARLIRRPKEAQVADAAVAPPPRRGSIAADYTPVENEILRSKYEKAISRSGFTGTARKIAFAVYTLDLDAGRGDLYTAIGLGRHLEEIGYQAIYLPQDRWYDLPDGVEIYVAMLETVDATRLPAGLTKVAWVRNQTEAWRDRGGLPLFDLVLASSQRSIDCLSPAYPGEIGFLPIGVDTELFRDEGLAADRRGVLSTVNQWGREREVFAYLKERAPDFPLALYGHQRGLAPELAQYSCGPVSFFSLPSLYNQARVVLDDFNHTTAGYGNVNSRVFEAAACGAIVMTNRATGLDALGLGDIPVYSSAPRLFNLIDRDIVGADALAAAGELGQMVREEHSYRQRAVEFNDHVEKIGSAAAGDGLVISYFPDYRDNPYTEMMWSTLRGQGTVAIPVGNELNFTATVRAAEHRPTVFHLNWTAPILGAAADEHDRLIRYRRFLEALDEMHEHGIPSIWTIHNVLPHECADRELEARLRQEIADRVDIIHVMCDETSTACAEWYQLPASKIRVIPHPGYIDVYPNLVDRATARRELGLGTDEFVYLHFGQIRPYKGIDRLLDAFDHVAQIDPEVRLLLVGKPGRFEGVRQIIDRARANPAVIGNFNPIGDDDVQLYMAAADVAVLPHETALNSGGLLLAYSFATPVVAPAAGCIGALVDDSTGITFNPGDGTRALQNAILSARDLTASHGKAAYERAAKLHYLDISTRFGDLVDELEAQ